MAKIGSSKKPAIIRVKSQKKAEEILSTCNENGWEIIIGVEPDEPEDISDFIRLSDPVVQRKIGFNVGRNDLCPCGSGKKYKKCCMDLKTSSASIRHPEEKNQQKLNSLDKMMQQA